MADEIEAKKQQVIDTAREQVDAGAHYLWSAAGNTPGNKDGAWYRTLKAQLHPNLPDLDNLSQDRNRAASKFNVHTPMLFGAFADTSDYGLLACAGRAGAVTAPLALAAMNSKPGQSVRFEMEKYYGRSVGRTARECGRHRKLPLASAQ